MGYLDLVLGEESEALEEEGGEAGEEEDGLVEQEGDDGGELELSEVGDQDLHSFPLRFPRRGRAERDRDLGMRTERRESRGEHTHTQRGRERGRGEREVGGTCHADSMADMGAAIMIAGGEDARRGGGEPEPGLWPALGGGGGVV